MSAIGWVRAAGLASLFLLPVPLEGQLEVVAKTPGDPVVLGRVFDRHTSQPVANADVILRSASEEVVASTLSDETGLFRLRPPGAGTFQITVRQIGFSTVMEPLEYGGGETLVVRVSLSVEPVEVEGVEATARRRPRHSEMNIEGFEARRLAGGGFFFDREDVERLRPSRVSDLFGRIPGVEVVRLGGVVRDVKIISSPGVNLRGQTTGRPCFASIWLDGILVREGGYQEGVKVGDAHKLFFLNDAVPPEQLGGVEVYTHAARIPQQFRDSSSMCGVIALWSHRNEGSREIPAPTSN